MSSFSTRLYQSQQLKQEMRINPRLYQAMELLYMPLLDLQQHLKTELEENPFLEMSEADVEEDTQVEEEGKEDSDDEIDWEEILLDGFDAGAGVSNSSSASISSPLRSSPTIYRTIFRTSCGSSTSLSGR